MKTYNDYMPERPGFPIPLSLTGEQLKPLRKVSNSLRSVDSRSERRGA